MAIDPTTAYTGGGLFQNATGLFGCPRQGLVPPEGDALRVLDEMRYQMLRQAIGCTALPEPTHFVHDPTPLAAKPSDPYATFKEAIKAGKEVEWLGISGKWQTGFNLVFSYPPERYRIKGEAADPYASLKAAQAEGKVIQVRTHDDGTGDWFSLSNPEWLSPPHFYRIKPDAPPPEPATVNSADVVWATTTEMRVLAGEGEGTASIPWPYCVPADPPSTALPECAGLMVVWQDPCWARR